MRKLNISFIVLLCFAMFTTTACKESDSAALPLESVDPDEPPPGVVDATGGFNIKVNPPDGTNYYIHKRSDFTQKCVVAKTATSMSDLDLECTVEIEELVGQFHGVNMVLNAPPEMCVYVQYTPYYYFGFEYGAGPTSATIRFNRDGAFVSGTIGAHGQFSPTGTPLCDYDYSRTAGQPNCCTGSYTLNTTINYGSTDPEYPPTTTTTTGNSWGGFEGNCVAGVGASAERDETYNMPRPTIYYSASGFSQQFAIGESLESNGWNSHYYANYFSGTAPAAFMMLGTQKGNPYYEWRCLDNAYDTIARIRVQVREWNEISQFELGSTGDPDTVAIDPDWGVSVNQLWDWYDEVNNGDNFPGMH